MRSIPAESSGPAPESMPGPSRASAARTATSRQRRRGPAILAGLAGIVAIALLVGSCGSPSGSDDSPGDTSTPNGGASPDRNTGTGGAQAPEGPALGIWGGHGPGQPNLDMTVDGRFAGTDGCNRLFGSWTEDEDTAAVHFSEVGSTRMACPDVDTWLERLHSGHVDGDLLRINDVDGAEIGTLARPR